MGKLSAPHFGPPAPYTRIPGQSPDYYSSLDNRRLACGHGTMKYRRGAWSTKKTGENNKKGKQTTSPEAIGVGTAALFITESPKHRKGSEGPDPLTSKRHPETGPHAPKDH
ncbi:hypothetical protein CRG98_043505 [Punica granatum]|uniref:Uncharacterized protein n=1 Tax=Punica granatum TaxID=22663 RepID=A0A2I0HWV4_PUNGR|nr:hypothetical protein CRG98_043505 [Punica granatum]